MEGADFKWGGRAPLVPPLAATLDHTLKDELVTEGDQFCTTSLAAGPELW